MRNLFFVLNVEKASVGTHCIEHQRSIQVKRPYQCKECGKLQSTLQPCTVIREFTHPGTSPINVRNVEKPFEVNSGLIQPESTPERRLIHTMKPEKVLTQMVVLLYNRKSTLRKKSYKCDESGENFQCQCSSCATSKNPHW